MKANSGEALETIRQFKKMSLWDFIDLLEEKCLGCHQAETYFIYLDEIKMRRIESISEGGNFKLKNLAFQLLAEFENERKSNEQFCSEKEYFDFKYTVKNEI